jgi:tRNA(Ile)-lysidine synthase
VDSLAMLYLVLPPDLSSMKKIVVCYVHHGTGEYADRAETFIRDEIKTLGLDFRVEHVTIDKNEEKQNGFEATARKARYRALEKVAEETGCTLILTAHTADDQAESVLLSLFRGAGSAGLSGVHEARGNIWRPLLHYTREELEGFLSDTGKKHIEDPGNRDLRFARNRVRHQLKPLILEQFGEGAWKNIARSAKRLIQTEMALETEAENVLKKVLVKRLPKWVLLDVELLASYLEELKAKVLRWAMALTLEEKPGELSLSRLDMRQLLGLVHANPGETAIIAGIVGVRKTSKGLIFDATVRFGEMEWKLPGTLLLPDGTLLEAKASQRAAFPGINKEPGRVEYIDAKIAGDVLKVRPWQEGDRFEPLGKPGSSVKVVKLLSGVDNRHQGPLWVIEKEEAILYIAGHRISHACRVSETTENIWRITCIFPEEIPLLRSK